MKQKICTSIKQSKELLRLGLSLNSADMHYATWTIIDGDFIVSPNQGDTIKSLQEDYGNQIIPCWSLSALLDLIPPYLGEFEDGIDFGFSKAMNCKWYSAHYIQLDNTGLATFTKTVTGDTAIDAAFEMVKWLIENNYIKTDNNASI